jgi:hypothetical protein
MSVRRLAILQWLAMGGGVVWWIAYLAGTGLSQATCNPGSARWGIPHTLVQIILTVVAGVLILGAEAAAIRVYLATRNVEEQDPPPQGRLHFFAAAAMVANPIFFMIILLTGIASIADRLCHSA